MPPQPIITRGPASAANYMTGPTILTADITDTEFISGCCWVCTGTTVAGRIFGKFHTVGGEGWGFGFNFNTPTAQIFEFAISDGGFTSFTTGGVPDPSTGADTVLFVGFMYDRGVTSGNPRVEYYTGEVAGSITLLTTVVGVGRAILQPGHPDQTGPMFVYRQDFGASSQHIDDAANWIGCWNTQLTLTDFNNISLGTVVKASDAWFLYKIEDVSPEPNSGTKLTTAGTIVGTLPASNPGFVGCTNNDPVIGGGGGIDEAQVSIGSGVRFGGDRVTI